MPHLHPMHAILECWLWLLNYRCPHAGAYQDAGSPQGDPFELVVRWGSAAAQGQRQAMEDAHVGVLDLQSQTDRAMHSAGAFFGVRHFLHVAVLVAINLDGHPKCLKALSTDIVIQESAVPVNRGASWMQVFDGHGGSSAAEFAEKNLLHALLTQTSFPAKPAEALVSALSLVPRFLHRPTSPCNCGASSNLREHMHMLCKRVI